MTFLNTPPVSTSLQVELSAESAGQSWIVLKLPHDATELLQFRVMSPSAMGFGFAHNHNVCLNFFRNLILSHKDAIQI